MPWINRQDGATSASAIASRSQVTGSPTPNYACLLYCSTGIQVHSVLVHNALYLRLSHIFSAHSICVAVGCEALVVTGLVSAYLEKW